MAETVQAFELPVGIDAYPSRFDFGVSERAGISGRLAPIAEILFDARVLGVCFHDWACCLWIASRLWKSQLPRVPIVQGSVWIASRLRKRQRPSLSLFAVLSLVLS
eukprot:1599044-Rhodomonas_salina.2